MVIRLRFLGILIGSLLLIPAVHATTVTWSSYIWNLNAHSQTCPGGNNCPTVRNGILNTTMANIALSYTGTYNSNIYQGQEDRSEEHTSELQSRLHLVCRLLLE